MSENDGINDKHAAEHRLKVALAASEGGDVEFAKEMAESAAGFLSKLRRPCSSCDTMFFALDGEERCGGASCKQVLDFVTPDWSTGGVAVSSMGGALAEIQRDGVYSVPLEGGDTTVSLPAGSKVQQNGSVRLVDGSIINLTPGKGQRLKGVSTAPPILVDACPTCNGSGRVDEFGLGMWSDCRECKPLKTKLPLITTSDIEKAIGETVKSALQLEGEPVKLTMPNWLKSDPDLPVAPIGSHWEQADGGLVFRKGVDEHTTFSYNDCWSLSAEDGRPVGRFSGEAARDRATVERIWGDCHGPFPGWPDEEPELPVAPIGCTTTKIPDYDCMAIDTLAGKRCFVVYNNIIKDVGWRRAVREIWTHSYCTTMKPFPGWPDEDVCAELHIHLKEPSPGCFCATCKGRSA